MSPKWNTYAVFSLATPSELQSSGGPGCFKPLYQFAPFDITLHITPGYREKKKILAILDACSSELRSFLLKSYRRPWYMLRTQYSYLAGPKSTTIIYLSTMPAT